MIQFFVDSNRKFEQSIYMSSSQDTDGSSGKRNNDIRTSQTSLKNNPSYVQLNKVRSEKSSDFMRSPLYLSARVNIVNF
jgi:hypothetical protein